MAESRLKKKMLSLYTTFSTCSRSVMAERSQEIIYDKMVSLCFIVINGMRLISFCGRNYRLENRERLCIKIEVEHLMNNLHASG